MSNQGQQPAQQPTQQPTPQPTPQPGTWGAGTNEGFGNGAYRDEVARSSGKKN